MTRFRLYLFLAALALIVNVPALAAPFQGRLSDSDLRNLGVAHPLSFTPILVGPDRTLLATEETRNREDLLQGIFHRLWILKFGSDARVTSARNIPLAMPRMVQANLTQDGRTLVLLARAGGSYWKLDLESGAMTQIFASERGKAGFLADPIVLWPQGGQMLVQGYATQADGTTGPNTLAAIDLECQTQPPFQVLGPDIDRVYSGFARVERTRWLAPDLGFATDVRDGSEHVVVLRGAGEPERIATYDEVSGFWADAGRLLFTGRRGDQWWTEVYDAATGQRWTSEPSSVRLTYAMLSRDGSTAMVTENAPDSGHMKVLFARVDEGFRFRPLEGFEKAPLALLRLSPDGRYLAGRDSRSTWFVELPR